MIRICAGLSDNVNCLIYQKTFFHQKPYQLWDYHGRMCVVDLDYGIIRQIIEIRATLSFASSKISLAALLTIKYC